MQSQHLMRQKQEDGEVEASLDYTTRSCQEERGRGRGEEKKENLWALLLRKSHWVMSLILRCHFICSKVFRGSTKPPAVIAVAKKITDRQMLKSGSRCLRMYAWQSRTTVTSGQVPPYLEDQGQCYCDSDAETLASLLEHRCPKDMIHSDTGRKFKLKNMFKATNHRSLNC